MKSQITIGGQGPQMFLGADEGPAPPPPTTTTPSIPEAVPVKDVAAALGVSAATVRKWVKLGRFPYIEAGRRRFIPRWFVARAAAANVGKLMREAAKHGGSSHDRLVRAVLVARHGLRAVAQMEKAWAEKLAANRTARPIVYAEGGLFEFFHHGTTASPVETDNAEEA